MFGLICGVIAVLSVRTGALGNGPAGIGQHAQVPARVAFIFAPVRSGRHHRRSTAANEPQTAAAGRTRRTRNANGLSRLLRLD